VSELNHSVSSYKHEEGILKFLKYFNGNSASLSQDFASYQNFGVLVWTKMKLAHGMTYISTVSSSLQIVLKILHGPKKIIF
jgi:hypothetical protein